MSRLVLKENPSGKGYVIPKGGDTRTAVNYDLQLYRRMIEALPGAEIEGISVLKGRVWHPTDEHFAFRNVGNFFTLFLEDGRKLDFSFKCQDGSVVSVGVGLYN